MKYEKIIKGIFVERPNRFVARVRLDDGAEIQAHVKNTGRCRELLQPGAAVYLEDFSERMGKRKLAFSLTAVEKKQENGDVLLVNLDSQAPNRAAGEALRSGKILLPSMGRLSVVKGEQTWGNSRFDFFVEDENGVCGYLEVKGVTLEENGIARFPDAPTQRGVKHVHELIRVKQSGREAFLLFILQMEGMKQLRPNDETHKAFGDALREAAHAGVQILAWECHVENDSMTVIRPVPVELADRKKKE
ncbi:MAG: DNA/RNA nuclease SfsA [Firmicutes bacterium]|nr:DNA/RNA nuclease SfsA [Bacillota bacterium]MDD7602921.1 DNA/RNA nuclease SfsA [Bacillota bacterium]MDY5857500.1 DNA/RNA nuclease SfsA [Anaerovoracaceae bacterium]